jgi:hypothetical protein
MNPLMDWKSTAVISGAGILATWFFSMPASQLSPSGRTAATTRAPQAAAATIDIQHEAERLQTRMHQQPRYVEPSRNPFAFGTRRPVAVRPAQAVTAAPPAVIAPPPPAPPRLALDGIAADTVDGQPQRTAILNTDAGVVLAHEGDQVSGYRVDKIGADLVQLVKVSDGSVLSLGLR